MYSNLKTCGFRRWSALLVTVGVVAAAAAGMLIALLAVGTMTGCGIIKSDNAKSYEIDYTVVEDQDLPVELKKLIDEKKANTLRLTYSTQDYTYVVAGYGTQQTSGYSIRVNDFYMGTNAIYADFTLIGPAAGEAVSEIATTPYIVLKMEKREEAVKFIL